MTKPKNITKRLRKKKVKLLANRIYFFFAASLLLTLVACGGQKNVIDYSNYVKIVSNTDSTVNELSAVSESKELNEQLNARFQSVSENKLLSSKIPEVRVEEKTNLLSECLTNFDSCKYVPEGYSFEIHRNFLNLHYQYNPFSSHDVFHKHAVIDLSSGKRILYLNMFSNPNQILELYNEQYVLENEAYLNEFSGKYLSQDELDEYDIIRNHLDSREPFQLHELNNCELIFDSETNRFTEIRFHYNGQGGIYKSVLSDGYISFPLKELESLLTEAFKYQLGKF